MWLSRMQMNSQSIRPSTGSGKKFEHPSDMMQVLAWDHDDNDDSVKHIDV